MKILLSKTVFFLPILFMSIPVGIENIRNMENSATGIRFDKVSLNAGLYAPSKSSSHGQK